MRDADQRIADVLHAIDRCQRYVGALDGDDADLLDMAEDAIERNLQIIGERVPSAPPQFEFASGASWLLDRLTNNGFSPLVRQRSLQPNLLRCPREVADRRG